MGALSPVSAAPFTRLGVKHLVQEAKQSSNISKEKYNATTVYLFLPEKV
jgi:hypothetical protein